MNVAHRRALWWALRAPCGPGWVVQDGRKVTVPASSRRHVLLVLASRLDRNMEVHASLGAIRLDTGLSWAQTRRAVLSLVEDGWVHRELRTPRPTVFTLALGRVE